MTHEWHQGHEASAFGGSGEVSLSFGWEAGTTAIEHTGVWVRVCLQARDVFVVDVTGYVLGLCFFHVDFSA